VLEESFWLLSILESGSLCSPTNFLYAKCVHWFLKFCLDRFVCVGVVSDY
jgi:hypothetical protein